MSKKIKRWGLGYSDIDEFDDGDYVLYEDHLKVVADKDAELAIAEKKAMEASYKLGLANAEIKRLRDAIKGALRIESLWMPRELSAEKYLEETRALRSMRRSFLDVLKEDA